MKTFLKNLESENFRLRFLKFSEIDSWSALENYTRIQSFILKGKFEVACSKWYKMYLTIVELLQTIRPLDKLRLINAYPMNGRCKPFEEYSKSGYIETDFGLYLRNPGAVNHIVPAIKYMLKLYGFNPEDAYLIVELTPDSAKDSSHNVIESQQKELYKYLKSIYVDADRYYNIAIKAIDAMNFTLRFYSTTTYNNLYLLSSSDYDKYASEAIERQLSRPHNSFTRSELSFAVVWLHDVRFLEGDYLNPQAKKQGTSYIVDQETKIKVTFNTHFLGEEDYE